MLAIIVNKSDEDDALDCANNLDFINREYKEANAVLRFYDADEDELERVTAKLERKNINYTIFRE